jgi:uncharacterized protein YbjT (DUF2867 family)
MKILVLGGTGLLGAPTVVELLAAGIQARLLVRDSEKARQLFGESVELITGDVTDLSALERAISGCEAVHICVGGSVDQASAENVAALAPRLGVTRISYVSGSTVDERNRWFPMVAQKLEAERALAESGVGYTIFRPTWPMEQLARFVRGGQAVIIGDRLPPLHWFAASDLGRLVARAHQVPEAAGRRLYVHGPEPWTMRQAIEQYCRALHPEIDAVSVLPVAVARAQADATGNAVLRFAADTMAYFDQAGELGSPEETERLLGAADTTLARWLAGRGAVTSGSRRGLP